VGNDKPAAPPINGVWNPVVVTARKPRELAPVTANWWSNFIQRAVHVYRAQHRKRTTCVPHQVVGSIIDLKFESFGAAPKTRPAKPAGPAS